MAGQDPSPQTTLLILLGASSWPLSKLGGSTAFGNAASDLRNYFLSDPKGFHLPKSNILDLFDLDDSNTDILNRISDFLKDHITTKKQLNADIRDVLVYYIGHGGLTKDSSIFYLAIRRTREDAEKSTSIAMDDLAERLKKDARFQRRILILDCCFAARALRFLQGSEPVTFVSAKTIAAFEEKDQGEGVPSKGTSFLASSGKDDPSVILPNETSTKFTSALLSALRTGDRYQEGERLTLHTVYRLTEDFLRKTYGNDFPQPELHSPDQTQGNIATTIAFFPNPSAGAERARLVEEDKERVRKAKDRRRQAEEEQARLAELDSIAEPLLRTCSRCGTPNADGARFCVACGTPMQGEERYFTPPEHPIVRNYPSGEAETQPLRAVPPESGYTPPQPTYPYSPEVLSQPKGQLFEVDWNITPGGQEVKTRESDIGEGQVQSTQGQFYLGPGTSTLPTTSTPRISFLKSVGDFAGEVLEAIGDFIEDDLEWGVFFFGVFDVLAVSISLGLWQKNWWIFVGSLLCSVILLIWGVSTIFRSIGYMIIIIFAISWSLIGWLFGSLFMGVLQATIADFAVGSQHLKITWGQGLAGALAVVGFFLSFFVHKYIFTEHGNMW